MIVNKRTQSRPLRRYQDQGERLQIENYKLSDDLETQKVSKRAKRLSEPFLRAAESGAAPADGALLVLFGYALTQMPADSGFRLTG